MHSLEALIQGGKVGWGVHVPITHHTEFFFMAIMHQGEKLVVTHHSNEVQLP